MAKIAAIVVTMATAFLGYTFWNTPAVVSIAQHDHKYSTGGLIIGGLISIALIFKSGEAWRESAEASLSFGESIYDDAGKRFWIEVMNRLGSSRKKEAAGAAPTRFNQVRASLAHATLLCVSWQRI